MPKKRISPEPVSTHDKIESAVAALRAKKLGVSERELSLIVAEWSRSADSWEDYESPLPERFLKRLNASVNRPVRGRPQGHAADTLERAHKEWKLFRAGYTCRQIAEELYPTHAAGMEPAVLKRLNRFGKLFDLALQAAMPPGTKMPE